MKLKMISKDFIRILNKYNKNSEASVYFLTDLTETNFIGISKTGVVYAPVEQVNQNKINPEDCLKESSEGYVPIIILG